MKSEKEKKSEFVTLSRRSGNGRRSDIGIGVFGHGSGSIAGDWGTRFSIEGSFLLLRRRWHDVVWVQFRVWSIIGGVRLRCRLGFFLFGAGGLGLGFVRFGGGGLGLGFGFVRFGGGGLGLGLGGGVSTHVAGDRSIGEEMASESGGERESRGVWDFNFQTSNSAKILKLFKTDSVQVSMLFLDLPVLLSLACPCFSRDFCFGLAMSLVFSSFFLYPKIYICIYDFKIIILFF